MNPEERKQILLTIIHLLTQLHETANKPRTETDLTPSGIDPAEWELLYGPLIRNAIRNLDIIARA